MADTRSFDEIEIRRPALAVSYLGLLRGQPGRPLALFAPRRVGKTFFLDQDLTPAARDQGLAPVYADVWLHRGAPLDAINHALEEALDDATVPAGRLTRAARTPVKKLAALGASLELGDEPRRRALPAAPELRLDTLVTRLAAAGGRPVLLMIDEIQALGELPQGEAIIGTLRAVLQKRKREVMAVFTGSSQEALAAMVAAAGGPMYQFAQLLDFPVLGDDYLEKLAAHFARVHQGKQPALDDLRRGFARIGHKPALMKDLLKAMSAEGDTDVDAALDRMVRDDRQVAGWRALLAGVLPLERGLLQAVAQGLPPLGRDTLAALAEATGEPVTIAQVRAALARLHRAGILTKPGGRHRIEDQLFAEHLGALALSRRRSA
jgi:hypothetical protein